MLSGEDCWLSLISISSNISAELAEPISGIVASDEVEVMKEETFSEYGRLESRFLSL